MKTNSPAEFAGEIDAELVDRDPNYLQRQLKGMRNGLRELQSAKWESRMASRCTGQR
jgi:hypothetical protein